MRRYPLEIGVVVVLTWWAVQTRAYVSVWRSNLSLTAHMVTHAPSKPRVLANHAVFVAATGDLHRAAVVLDMAERATEQPHVRPFDRRRVQELVASNRRGVERLLVLTR